MINVNKTNVLLLRMASTEKWVSMLKEQTLKKNDTAAVDMASRKWLNYPFKCVLCCRTEFLY